MKRALIAEWLAVLSRLVLSAAFVVAMLSDAAQAQSGRRHPLDDKPPPPPPQASPRRPIHASDAVASALHWHPDLSIAAATGAESKAEVRRQHAMLWTPTLTLDSSFRQGWTPTASYAVASSGVVSETALDVLISLAGRTDIGTRYELRWDNRRETTSAYSDFFPITPLYRSNLVLAVVQPLLRGGWRAANTASLAVAKRTAAASAQEARQTAERVVQDVLTRYYEWAGRKRELEIRQNALVLAREQRKLTQLKISGGGLPASEIAQADATLAAQETLLTTAEGQMRDAEGALLRVSYLNQEPNFAWDTELDPIDELTDDGKELDIRDCVAIALDHRPEPKAALELVHAQEALVASAANARLLRLDARAEVGALGLAGALNPAGPTPADSSSGGTPTSSVLPGQGIATPNQRIIGGFGTALANAWRMDTFYYLLGLTLELPLGNSQRNAELALAELQLRRRQAELFRVRSEISVAVRTTALQLRSDRRRLDTTRRAVRSATLNLEAEQRRFQLGGSTTFDILRVQAELTTAQLMEAQTLVQLNLSRIKLDRELGLLLERLGLATQ
jgi:outer membrane protein TolC